VSKRGNGEGNFRERKPGQWEGRVSYKDPASGRLKPVSVYGKTRAEAVEKLKEKMTRIEAGLPIRDSSVTVGQYAKQWLERTLPVSGNRAQSIGTYRSNVSARILPLDIAAVSMEKLRPHHVEDWLAALQARGLGSASRRQAYSVLKSLLDTAVRDKLLTRNPVPELPRPKKAPKRKPRFLTAGEVERLLDAAKTARVYRPVVEFLVHTGMRRGEALAVTWENVDMEGRVIFSDATLVRVNGKLIRQEVPKTDDSARWIPMTEQCHELLLAQSPAPSGLVWMTRDGGLLEPHNLWRAVVTAAAKAKLADVHPHTLRHTAASLMIGAGVPLKAVSEFLGHSSISITADLYGQIQPNVVKDAAAKLGAALGSAVPKLVPKLGAGDGLSRAATVDDSEAADAA
jgi:integrase